MAEAELPARFQLTRSSAIVVAGATVGSIERDAPLDTWCAGSVLSALFSFLLDSCTYLAVRILSVAGTRQTLIHLAGANKTIHEKNAISKARTVPCSNARPPCDPPRRFFSTAPTSSSKPSVSARSATGATESGDQYLLGARAFPSARVRRRKL